MSCARLVLDTNVLVSGLLNPDGTPATVLNLILLGRAMICVDARVLHEYRMVLPRPKFGFAPTQLADLLDFLEHEASEPVTPSPLPSVVLPDRQDLPFLEIAFSARVPLVTGNRRHFPEEQCRGVEVLSPAEWLAKMQASGTSLL